MSNETYLIPLTNWSHYPLSHYAATTVITKLMLRFCLHQGKEFKERIPLSLSADPHQIPWSPSWSNLWYLHDCFIAPNHWIHFGFPILSNWFCARGFYGVAKVFVWKPNLDKKSPFVTLPSHQHDYLASDCSFLSKWKEQKPTRGIFNLSNTTLIS